MTGSRACGGKECVYEWHGDDLPAHGCMVEHAVADWFASICANELLAMGMLSARCFNRFCDRIAGQVAAKLVAVAAGEASPGTEVVPVASADVDGVPMFEFRWTFETSLLNGRGRKVLVRHYDAEPNDRSGVIFGLLIHRKDVSGSDGEVKAKQNEQIRRAIAICRERVAGGWSC